MSISGICKSASELTKWCAAAACCKAKNNKMHAVGFTVCAVAFGVIAYLAAKTWMDDAKATVAPKKEEGEVWMGHFFPYSKYPHGHFDCAHGSTVLEPLRMQDNERKREDSFQRDGICSRGMKEICIQVFNEAKQYISQCCTIDGKKVVKL